MATRSIDVLDFLDFAVFHFIKGNGRCAVSVRVWRPMDELGPHMRPAIHSWLESRCSVSRLRQILDDTGLDFDWTPPSSAG